MLLCLIKMVDNFELIESLLDFSNEHDEFYFVQVIQRKKDHKESNRRLGRNNSARLIKAFYINNKQKWDEYKDEIIELCKLFNARAGINLNRRSHKMVSLEMMEQLAHNIKSENYYQGGLFNNVCGQVRGSDRTWIIDIDNDDMAYVQHIRESLKLYRPYDEDKVIATVPTKSGIHLITNPFDLMNFGKDFPELEVHKNNPTNLYIV